MSMSTSIIGLVSEDNDLYKKHKKVLLACIEADIQELPKETAEFFGTSWVDESLLKDKLTIDINYVEKTENSGNVYEILLKNIPKEVEKIQFINSW